MICQPLFDRALEPQVVRAALIGCGSFGAPLVTQTRPIPRLEIRVVADTDIEAARSAFLRAGADESDIAVCGSCSSALQAMEPWKRVIAEDATILMDLPVHVEVTAIRTPEAGARYDCEAIRHSKHVVLVDKEADSVVGPILKRMADRAGVVLTTDGGDQPGLLIGLVSWARALGLEVLCGGHLHECFYEPESGTITMDGHPPAAVPLEAQWAIEPIPEGESQRYAATRRRLTGLWRPYEEDGDTFAHIAVTANGTGLMPDTPVCHRPLLRLSELPEALCPTSDGGILSTRGAADLPTLLRTEEASGADGGVFIIVSNAVELSRDIMADKGLLANPAAPPCSSTGPTTCAARRQPYPSLPLWGR
ncbi:MAG: hypothetical protein IT210_20605 [Armatimonadetes bacterium]|nr:hypothetical protein [Armatimonadota bacterium]